MSDYRSICPIGARNRAPRRVAVSLGLALMAAIPLLGDEATNAVVSTPTPSIAVPLHIKSVIVWLGPAMFGFLFALEALGDLTAGRNALQALTVFLTCVAIYLLAPLVTLLAESDRLVDSRFYHIATGTVLGGTLYLIFLFFYLSTRKTKAK